MKVKIPDIDGKWLVLAGTGCLFTLASYIGGNSEALTQFAMLFSIMCLFVSWDIGRARSEKRKRHSADVDQIARYQEAFRRMKEADSYLEVDLSDLFDEQESEES